MTENKFSRTRSTPNKPYICKSKPPPRPPPPYHPYPPGRGMGRGSVTEALMLHQLPPIPKPPFQPIKTRNLIYHVYPHKSTNDWMSNLHQLTKHWSIFNGRRIVAVAQGDNLWPITHVECLLPKTTQILMVNNSPRLREAASFPRLLRNVKNVSANQATFFAHTKGADHNRPQNSPQRKAIKIWRDTMYDKLLSNPTQLAALFLHYAAIGCFKIDYSHIPGYEMLSPTGARIGNWHFAGAFYWFRHDQVFRNPAWTNIPDDPYSAEMWIGQVIPSDLSHSVYGHHPAAHHPHPDLYDCATHFNLLKGDPHS